MEENILLIPPVVEKLSGNNNNNKNYLILFVGRGDVPATEYADNLCSNIQKELSSRDIPSWVLIEKNLTDATAEKIHELAIKYNISQLHLVAHSMSDGGIQAQGFVKKASENLDLLPLPILSLSLVAGFLTRTQRPGVMSCLAKKNIRPRPTLKHPLGYLEDGVHKCTGGNTPSLFPIPTLSVGGSLDGVVRVTRLAEAYYTQQLLNTGKKTKVATSALLFPVVVLPGVNHASLITTNSSSGIPSDVLSRDLRAETDAAQAQAMVARIIADFFGTVANRNETISDSLLTAVQRSASFFDPILEAFVRLEGSWFFTGFDDEHGSSEWAATAQQLMAKPLPEQKGGGGADAWIWEGSRNQFHMLTDEEKIPPYYRHRHRPEIIVDFKNKTLCSSTVAQLRYIQLTPAETAYGLDGYKIIEEEKVNILAAMEEDDDGQEPVSAIEIAVKLASRQYIFNHTNQSSASPDLDAGSRCRTINSKAYQWALTAVQPAERERFERYGVPLVMGEDRKPVIPAGPWWIYTYLAFEDEARGGAVNVSSYFAFYPMDANPYGAGNHYCKLLSPARALEWILIDGLRRKYSIYHF